MFHSLDRWVWNAPTTAHNAYIPFKMTQYYPFHSYTSERLGRTLHTHFGRQCLNMNLSLHISGKKKNDCGSKEWQYVMLSRISLQWFAVHSIIRLRWLIRCDLLGYISLLSTSMKHNPINTNVVWVITQSNSNCSSYN